MSVLPRRKRGPPPPPKSVTRLEFCPYSQSRQLAERGENELIFDGLGQNAVMAAVFAETIEELQAETTFLGHDHSNRRQRNVDWH